jgi:hypothetical protein
VSTKPGAGHRLLLNGRDISKSPSRKFEIAILSRSSASFSQFAASNSQKALSASFNELSAFLWHRTASFRYSSASPDIFTVFQLQLGRLLDARLRIKMGQISGNCQRTRPRVRTPFVRMLPRVMGVLFRKIMGSQHHGLVGLCLFFEEFTRGTLFNDFPQPHKLVYALICLYVTPTFKIVHRCGADSA